MNFAKMGFLAYGLATWLALTPSGALGQTPPSPTPFQVFDGTLYRNKPDLQRSVATSSHLQRQHRSQSAELGQPLTVRG